MDVKIKRRCSECGVEYEAASGKVCEDCWPAFRDANPEWLEFIRQFPGLA